MTLRDALALSLNTVAVKLGLEVGPKAVVQTAHRLGITSPLQANPSIALGTSEVTPLELVAAYAAFANGGTGVIPYVITQVKTAGRQGPLPAARRRRPRPGGRSRRGRDDERHDAQTFVIGTAKKAEIPGWDTAGKTGTSQDFRDAWFVGFTGILVAGRLARQRRRRADEARLGRQPAGRGLERLHAARRSRARPVPLPGGGRRAGRRATRRSRAPTGA